MKFLPLLLLFVSAEVAVDLPVSIDNTALQAVPDYRLRGGISVQF